MSCPELGRGCSPFDFWVDASNFCSKLKYHTVPVAKASPTPISPLKVGAIKRFALSGASVTTHDRSQDRRPLLMSARNSIWVFIFSKPTTNVSILYQSFRKLRFWKLDAEYIKVQNHGWMIPSCSVLLWLSSTLWPDRQLVTSRLILVFDKVLLGLRSPLSFAKSLMKLFICITNYTACCVSIEEALYIPVFSLLRLFFLWV